MTEKNPKNQYRSITEHPIFRAVMFAIIFGVLAWGRLTNVRSYSFTIPLDNPNLPVIVDLNLGEGNATIESLPDGATDLFDAAITTPGSVEMDTDFNEDDVSIEIDYAPLSPLVGLLFGNGDNQRNWEVQLNRNVPTTLLVNSGVGRTDMDLRDIALMYVEIDSGFAPVDVRLPGGEYMARIATGEGRVEIDCGR